MAKVNDLLTSRFKKASQKLTKMTNLAEMSSSGKLSSFAGVFQVRPLAEHEEEHLKEILRTYSDEEKEITEDLVFLSSITSEVKAINNQAAMLHGERIKKAQAILKEYRDGAFSAWLIATYGNRQTPYNFLQFYDLYTSIPKPLQEKVDDMPRQAIYTLASRSCPQEEKETLIENYQGETKKELLALIREKFPLENKDKRAPNLAEKLIQELLQLEGRLGSRRYKPSASQKKRLQEVLQSIQNKI